MGKKTITDDQLAERKNEAMEALRRAEQKRLFVDRNCAGDASETGLIKFVQPIMDLTKKRSKFGTYCYDEAGKTVECLIPFNSEIKFNLFIRDMGARNKGTFSDSEKNLCVIMKGAPERIISRCSKVLIRGEERPFDEAARAEVDKANDTLGKMGERVLAFARLHLDPEMYDK